MKRSSLALLCLLAAAAAAWFMSSPLDSSTAQAKGKPTKEYRSMSGMLALVDAQSRLIVVSNAAINRKFDVAPEAEIIRDGRPCGLANLRKGSAASIYYSVEAGKKIAHRVITQENAPAAPGHGKEETRPVEDASDR